MLTKVWDTTADCTVALLLHYIFDLGGYSARALVGHWLSNYPANWVRLAVIEALYQGRYKAVSVEQILGFWQRRGQALPHFNCEFERLVCGNIQPRLTRKSPPHPTGNSPLDIKLSAYLSNEDRRSGIAKSSSANTSQATPSQTVDIPAQVVPETKQMNGASNQSKHQLSNTNPKSQMRSLLSALTSSVSQQPIRQFNPATTKSSDFYTKLKAISEQN
jgi:hypothetical protein